MRHGEAVSEAVNAERPLSTTGRQQIESIARQAVSKDVRVSAIYHSGILRARQTAEILAGQLGTGAKVSPTSGLHPEDDPAIAKAELEAADSSIMLVGHLPHMNRLAALLVNDNSDREAVGFGPGTLVCCSRTGSQWKIAWILRP